VWIWILDDRRHVKALVHGSIRESKLKWGRGSCQQRRLRPGAIVIPTETLPEPAAAVQLLPASENDREVERLAPGALVVNATGLGCAGAARDAADCGGG
jgi:hypothetical protein